MGIMNVIREVAVGLGIATGQQATQPVEAPVTPVRTTIESSDLPKGPSERVCKDVRSGKAPWRDGCGVDVPSPDEGPTNTKKKTVGASSPHSASVHRTEITTVSAAEKGNCGRIFTVACNGTKNIPTDPEIAVPAQQYALNNTPGH